MNRIVSASSLVSILVSALALGSVACAPTAEEEESASRPEAAQEGPATIAAPERDPSVIKCITNSGDHDVTVDQCKQLLTIAGCKPGAVVGDTMKCSTSSTESDDGSPDDLANPGRPPSVIKCFTAGGTVDVTIDQCKTLLTAGGCKPGAVLGDTMKCSKN